MAPFGPVISSSLFAMVIMPKLQPEMTQNAITMVIQEYANTQ